MYKRVRAAGIWLAAVLAAYCSPAWAGEFSVNPIRLELGASVRSGVITVRNESKAPMSFQLQGMEWTQDADGKDVYAGTEELIFFPKLMSLDPGREAVVRVGVRQPLVDKERTYRLFIEELPAAPPAGGRGPQLSVVLRFGAPVFVRPAKPQDGLELEAVALARGEISLVAHNTGNQHQFVEGVRITGTDAGGAEVYSMTLADRYLLAGTRKRYQTAIPAEQCARLAHLAVEFKTNKLTQSSRLPVQRAMCS